MFFGLRAAQQTSEYVQVRSIFMNFIHFDIPKWCEHKHRYKYFLKLHFEIRIKAQRKFSSFKVLVQELKTFEVSPLFPLTSPYAFSEAFFASSAKSGAPSARANRTSGIFDSELVKARRDTYLHQATGTKHRMPRAGAWPLHMGRNLSKKGQV